MEINDEMLERYLHRITNSLEEINESLKSILKKELGLEDD
jgi:hypothetical protein